MSLEAKAGEKKSHKSVIMIYMCGGPPHQDMYDIKTDAPAEIRGPFDPIPTVVPGIEVCELLPNLARIMDKLVPIRTVVGCRDEHAGYQCFTGHLSANPPAGGSVSYQGGLGYLPQDPRLDMVPDDVTALNHVLSGRGFTEALERMAKLQQAMENDPTPRAIDRYTKAIERFRMDGGYAAESEVRRLAAGIGLADDKLDLPLRICQGAAVCERHNVVIERNGVIRGGDEQTLRKLHCQGPVPKRYLGDEAAEHKRTGGGRFHRAPAPARLEPIEPAPFATRL